jgi:hypothetical protein
LFGCLFDGFVKGVAAGRTRRPAIFIDQDQLASASADRNPANYNLATQLLFATEASQIRFGGYPKTASRKGTVPFCSADSAKLGQSPPDDRF